MRLDRDFDDIVNRVVLCIVVLAGIAALASADSLWVWLAYQTGLVDLAPGEEIPRISRFEMTFSAGIIGLALSFAVRAWR